MAKVLVEQTRTDVHKPTVLAKLPESRFRIRRETDGMDLSAPPLKPKTDPARTCSMVLENGDLEPSPPIEANSQLCPAFLTDL